MKIHLLAALALVLFSTADITAQSYPYWPTSSPSFYGGYDNYYDSTSQPGETGFDQDYWVHYEEDDTAAGKVYRRYNTTGPSSETPHVVALLRGGYGYDNTSGLDGSWTQNEDNNVVLTLGNTQYVFSTARLEEDILILIEQ